MSKSSKSSSSKSAHVAVQQVETPAAVQQAPAPAATQAVEAPKAKKLRYAPVQVLANPDWVITSVAANPKRPGSKAHAKYSLFEIGLSIKQVEEKFVAAGYQRLKARNELRWDLEHGFITVEPKA